MGTLYVGERLKLLKNNRIGMDSPRTAAERTAPAVSTPVWAVHTVHGGARKAKEVAGGRAGAGGVGRAHLARHP